jgi:hypothetical protein
VVDRFNRILTVKALKPGRATVRLTSPGARSTTIKITVVPETKAKAKRQCHLPTTWDRLVGVFACI